MDTSLFWRRGGDSPGYCGMYSNIPGLCPADSGSNTPSAPTRSLQVVLTKKKKVSGHCLMSLERKIARCWESPVTEKTQKSCQATIKPLCKEHRVSKDISANTLWLAAFPLRARSSRSGLITSHLVSFCSKLGPCVYWPSVVKCSSPSSKAALCNKSLKAMSLCIKYLLEVLGNSFIHILFLPWSLFIGSGMRSIGPSRVQVIDTCYTLWIPTTQQGLLRGLRHTQIHRNSRIRMTQIQPQTFTIITYEISSTHSRSGL